MSNNNSEFKSLYQDGLIPTKEYHDISKDILKTIDDVFKKYIEAGYSPRELTALTHSITECIGSEKAILLTLKKRKNLKKTLTNP